jgi:hypothetical protein
LKNKKLTIHLWSLLASVATAFLFWGSLNISSHLTQPANCMPAHCFCEYVDMQSSIKQFSNTFSSFAFVYVGWVIFFSSVYTKDTLMKIFGISSVFIGFGSAFFHATLTFLGQVLDLAGMFLLSSFILLYAIHRIFHLTRTNTIILLIVSNVILDGGLFIVPEMRRYLFGALIVSGLLGELFYIKKQHNPIDTKWLKYAFAILLIAFGIWILDLTKVVCEPTSLWQGHTLWHILSAIATYLLYLYYRQEKNKD